MMTPMAMTTKRRKNNTANNLKNGKRVQRLAFGELPSCMARVTRYCREYRRRLEKAVLAVSGDGGMTLQQAHLIDAACTHMQHSSVCLWLLRQRIDDMATSDIRECSKQIAQSRDARNRAVAALELDKEDDPWNRLYVDPVDDGLNDDGPEKTSE